MINCWRDCFNVLPYFKIIQQKTYNFCILLLRSHFYFKAQIKRFRETFAKNLIFYSELEITSRNMTKQKFYIFDFVFHC